MHTDWRERVQTALCSAFLFCCWEKLNQLCALIPTKIKLNSLFHQNILSLDGSFSFILCLCALGKVSHGHLIMLKLYFPAREISCHAKWLFVVFGGAKNEERLYLYMSNSKRLISKLKAAILVAKYQGWNPVSSRSRYNHDDDNEKNYFHINYSWL